MRKPTRKQIIFVNTYIHTNNATQSAIAAGYSEKNAHTIAGQLLLKPQVKELLDKSLADKEAASIVTFDWKMDKLREILEGSLSAEPAQRAIAIKAVEVMNTMQGHNAENKSVHVNIDTTIEKLQQARLAYKEY